MNGTARPDVATADVLPTAAPEAHPDSVAVELARLLRGPRRASGPSPPGAGAARPRAVTSPT